MSKRLLVTLSLAVALTGCGGVEAAQGPLPSVSASPSPSPTATQAKAEEPAKAPRPDPRTPKHITLWKFNAPVVPLTLQGNELVPPSDPSIIGWWGKPAGAKHGTTLLTGHTVHTGGGEFDDLEKTPVGSVANVSGVKYTVASVEVIPKEELASRAPNLFSQQGKPRLVLITCEGYNWDTGVYADSVVVIATPVS